MPKIKTAEYLTGVVIDAEGFYVTSLKWKSDETPPQYNTYNENGDVVGGKPNKLLTGTDVEGATKGAKWNAKTKQWIKPDTKLWVVDERSGGLRGTVHAFMDRLPNPPFGAFFVDTPYPADRSKAWLYDEDLDEWVCPYPVAILDENDKVVNVALESPRAKDPGVPLPAGHKKLGSKSSFPLDEVGVPVAIGMKRAPDGKFPKLPELEVKTKP